MSDFIADPNNADALKAKIIVLEVVLFFFIFFYNLLLWNEARRHLILL